MKWIIVALVLLSSMSGAYAACAPGDNFTVINSTHIEACNCTQEYVQYAVDNATNSVTVLVPVGECTWSTSITILDSKKIILQGAGINNTNISIGAINAINVGTSGSRVNGFTFNISSTSGRGVTMSGDNGARVDHCAFDGRSSGGKSTGVYYSNLGKYYPTWDINGLVDNNIFYDAAIVVNGPAAPNPSDYQAWAIWSSATELGGISAVYVENNTFYMENFGNSMDGNYGGAYVFRYNEIYKGSVSGSAVDAHSLQCNCRGYKQWEIYKNIIDAEDSGSPSLLRAGTGVMWDNTISGTWNNYKILLDNRRSFELYAVPGRCNGSSAWDGNEPIDNDIVYGYGGSGVHGGSGNSATLNDSGASWITDSLVGITVYNLDDGSNGSITSNTATAVIATMENGTENDWDIGDTYKITDGYPCRDQIGRGQDDYAWDNSEPYPSQISKPSYAFGNSPSDVYMYAQASSDHHIKDNRDYYNYNATFDGTTGVGNGTLSSIPSTCTVGVGYWATDVGEWDSTSAGNDGMLYKCTSTNIWTAYYAPFDYPHPFSSGIPGVSLSLPQNTDSINETTINFTCSVIDSGNLINVTLYGNWNGGWHANETKVITGVLNETTFTKTLPEGDYIWNCLAYDEDNNTDWNNMNFSLTVGNGTFSPSHTKAYYNDTSQIQNVANSTGYNLWNRTITLSDTECSFNIEVTI